MSDILVYDPVTFIIYIMSFKGDLYTIINSLEFKIWERGRWVAIDMNPLRSLTHLMEWVVCIILSITLSFVISMHYPL